ncbi:small serum protein 2-like [Candoia aspera]|uniref:small serum protein 2-like n=1 Tax=Candoia aspera TaxID=51853 RepID=UPI002FD80564
MKYFSFITSTKQTPAICEANVFLLAVANLAECSPRKFFGKCSRGGLGSYIAFLDICINWRSRCPADLREKGYSWSQKSLLLTKSFWTFPKARMRVFFSLMIFSFTLATCERACWFKEHQLEVRDGQEVRPNTCTDPHDNTTHLILSTWNTAYCLRCECRRAGRICCERFPDIAEKEGCKSVANTETCEYELYSLDDPSKRCS